MKKALCVFVSLVLLLGCAGLPAFAEGYASAAEANADLQTVFDAYKNLGDVDGSGTVTAKDARAILVYSAELFDRLADCPYLETERMDLDHDGAITAVDARLALRYSAKLISANDIMSSDQKLLMFNTIINNLKGNKQSVQFYYATKDTTKVSWDNTSAVNSFDSQLANLSKADDGMSSDNFSSSLKAAEGTTYYSPRSANTRILIRTDIPLTDTEVSSRLTASDVKSISYKTNQSVTMDFTYRVVNNQPLAYVDPVTLTGLDAITVELHNDSVSGVPNNFNNFHAAKLIDLPDINEIKAESAELAAEMDDVKASMSDMGDIDVFKSDKFNLSASINGCKVRNVKVTVYFNPNTGKPVATVFDYDFDYITKMFIDIKLQLNWSALATIAVSKLKDAGVSIDNNPFNKDSRMLLKVENQTVNVTNTKHTYANYYFVSNNTNP